MKTTDRISLVIAIFLLIFLVPFDSLALRCGNRLVSKGDRKIEVLEKCGEPALVEEWREELEIFKGRKGKKFKSIRNLYIEEWTYNFGSKRFLQFLIFKNGRLYTIIEGERGYDGEIPALSDKTRCGKMLDIGDRKIEVLIKCGEPTLKDVRIEERVDERFDKDNNIHEDRTVEVTTEEWSYNFGPHSFLQFIKIENGRVISIEQGGYGF